MAYRTKYHNLIWNNYLNAPELNAYYKWIASYGENDSKPSASFAQKDELESYVIWPGVTLCPRCFFEGLKGGENC